MQPSTKRSVGSTKKKLKLKVKKIRHRSKRKGMYLVTPDGRGLIKYNSDAIVRTECVF